jgi:hypothetical protein
VTARARKQLAQRVTDRFLPFSHATLHLPMILRPRFLLVWFAVAAFVGACASGPRLIMGQPIKKDVSVLVHVSKDTHGDQFGGIESIVETVTDGLTKRGIPNQLYAADDDHPGTPRIEIWVTKWGEGDAALRDTGRVVGGMVGAALSAGGAGQYEVVTKIYREGDVNPACEKTHSGSVDPDDAQAVVNTGELIGSSILQDALRDTNECSDTPPDHDYSVR